MYAVCVEYYGNYGAIVPAGNDGLQKLHNKTRRGWLSEMSPRQLADYVQNNNITCL